MPKSIVRLSGERLPLEAYVADAQERIWKADESGCWKLERQQHFIEPGDDSWEAFAAGDWDRSLRLLNDRRRDLKQYHKRVQRSGFEISRVRVVQEPIGAYLIWELNALQVRYECGAKIRVVDVEQVEPLESNGVLPEIFIVGRSTAYQVLYGEDGAAEGAIRTTDRDVIEQWTTLTKDLYADGEEMDSYFKKKVAGLKPPRVG
jgi:Family of unknown function (DUF6879)